jgi:site-specific DNA recombinase
LIEKRNVEIHLVKEARIIGKESRSQDKFMHDIHVAVAKHYVENLKEEVKKGMREKAEQGVYPGRAPVGYRNNSLNRSIEIHKNHGPIVQRIFEMYSSGNYSLSTLRKAVLTETGVRFARSYLGTMLKNPFYMGRFVWRGVEYKGTHDALISPQLFQRVQDAFAGRNKPRYRKHDFAFAQLLRCGHDDCRITTELQKGKYVYYRCSKGRGKCPLPYMREEYLSDRLADVLKGIYVPEEIARTIVASLQADLGKLQAQQKEQVAAIQQRLTMVRTRMDQIYEDKLEGKIDEEFWARKQAEYREQERKMEASLFSLKLTVSSDHLLTVQRVFELANKAHFLYLTRNVAERGQLLKSVLLNCTTDGVSLSPDYRKPFDLIFQRAKNENWSGREDLNLRPPGPETTTAIPPWQWRTDPVGQFRGPAF